VRGLVRLHIRQAQTRKQEKSLLSPSAQQSSTTRLLACSLAIAAGIAALVSVDSGGTAAAQKVAMSAKAKHGESVFKQQCVGCHNKQAGDTTPFGPPNLHGLIGGANPMVTPQEAVETITKGKGIMPAFEGKLTPQDINSVVAYLKTQ
jgi:mono/diheme cytochrome c family protein